MSKKQRQQQDDFDPRHEIAAIAAKLNQPDKFAAVFCEAASTQISIVDAMTGLMERALVNNVSTRNHVKDIAKETIKEATWSNWSIAAGWVSSLFFAAVMGGYFKW